MLVSLVPLIITIYASLVSCQFYENTPVISLNQQSFSHHVLNTNHVTLVEFYAPWCKYCVQLKSDYIRAATMLKGIVKVAAINCDEEQNKPLCGKYGVKGFPSLKVFGPQKKSGSGTTRGKSSSLLEDYTGGRTAKDITSSMIARFKQVAKVKTISSESGINAFTKDTKKTRVLLIPRANQLKSNQQYTPPALFKSLSVDFQSDNVAFVCGTPTVASKLIEALDVSSKITKESSNSMLLVIPSAGSEQETPYIYQGEMKRDPIMQFLSKHLNQTDPINKPALQGKKAKRAGSKKQKKQNKRDEL